MRLLYIIILAAAVGMTGCSQKEKEKDKTASKNVPRYELILLKKGEMEQTLRLPAQLAAYMEVSIYPKVNGYVNTVSVDIGTKVQKGQLLMTLDAPEVRQATAQAKEKYEKAKLDFSLSKENYSRLLIAAQTPGAIAKMELATAKAKMESDSALSNAEKANWQMQQAMTDYLRVTAPFNGVITERNTHPGALVSTGSKDKSLLELKQVDHLRLQVDIPENLAASLKLGEKVDFFLTAMPGKKMQAQVSRKSGNVDLQYRTERVELDVSNSDNLLSPGMYAEVLFKATGNQEAWLVPKSAVITSTERRYVVAIRDKKAVKVDVSIGLSDANQVEIMGDLKAGESVLKVANDEIEEGTEIF